MIARVRGSQKISIGVRAGGDLVEDTYSNNILITVITNPVLKTATFKKIIVYIIRLCIVEVIIIVCHLRDALLLYTPFRELIS